MTTAVILPSPRGAIAVGDHDPGPPAAGEVQIAMEACGVCHSDLMIAGLEELPLAPLVIGHEGIGRVSEVGPAVDALAVGDRVGVTFLASTCGACEPCRAGHERFCPRQVQHGFSRHGAMGQVINAAAAHLVRVPDGLPAVAAAPLCCAGWTALGAVRGAGLPPGGRLAVVGLGGVGHLAVQYARQLGIKVVAVDVNEAKLEQARALGAELALPAADAGRAIAKAFGGVDAAIAFTAAPEALRQALRSLKRRATLYLVGMADGARVDLSLNDAIIRGVAVRGSFLGTRADLEDAFAMAANGVALPHVEVCHPGEVAGVLDRLRAGQVLGRAVVSFA